MGDRLKDLKHVSLVFQNPPVIPRVWRCEFGTPKGLASGGVLGVQMTSSQEVALDV